MSCISVYIPGSSVGRVVRSNPGMSKDTQLVAFYHRKDGEPESLSSPEHQEGSRVFVFAAVFLFYKNNCCSPFSKIALLMCHL